MNYYALEHYLDLLGQAQLLQHSDFPAPLREQTVRRLTCDSRTVGEQTLFICKGAHFKEEYLHDALRAGAFCYLSERAYAVDAPCILVRDVRKAMALVSAEYYNRPWEQLRLIGITGTKGKSSTTYFVKYILDEYQKSRGGKESGVLSSIDTYDGVVREESHLTTPESIDLQRHFRNAVDSGLSYLEMEVSSQALKYDRTLGVEFDVGCFLNIGRDHISAVEHPDFEDYFSSKLRLFDQCRVACVNLDSDRAEEALAKARQGSAQRVITFGTDPKAQVYGYDIRKKGNDILFQVRTPDFHREFRLTMPGLFNVSNALAAIAICTALGIPDHYMYVGLNKARVSGRMEIYANVSNQVIAIVDYAHNRMSFETLYQSVKAEYPGRDIVTVFGCPGYKAQERRRDLGELSGRYSQRVILTEEDAGEEPLMDICREIARYVEQEHCPYSIVPDRGEAIATAILGCERESVVLVTGKGNETRQKRGLAYIDCPTDVEYVRQALKQYDVEHHLDGEEMLRAVTQALPRLRPYRGRTILVKYGGSALEEEENRQSILEDIAALEMAGARVIVVHGGGKAISLLMTRLGLEHRFVGGYRVTTPRGMETAQMALTGQVGPELAAGLQALEVPALTLSGRDGGLIQAVEKTAPDGTALGRVGQIVSVDPAVVRMALAGGYVPVISPVSADGQHQALNVNADDAACAIAQALQVDELVFLTDVEGIRIDKDNGDTLAPVLDLDRAQELIDSGFVEGGMVPKLSSCVSAIRAKVGRVAVLDGRVRHSLLLYALGQNPSGTVIVP